MPCLIVVGGLTSASYAQTTINGNVMALQSSGAAAGTGWTLSSDGYVGTYIDLTSPAPVTFTVAASGTQSGGIDPDMTLSIADSTQSFTVNPSGTNNYTYTTPTLAAGTYFVRTQLDNQDAALSETPNLTVGSMTVSGTGVTVLNSGSTTNATNAATTYATNYREGPGTVTLTNANGVHLGAGTSVEVKLIDNAFNFAGATYGFDQYYEPPQWMNVGANGQNQTPNTTEETNYQNAITKNFNMIVPANAGKWGNNESTQGSPFMNDVDAMDQFAAQNGLSMRMHNLLWNTEQPSFVTNLFAANGTLTAANKTTLLNDITSRINYYLSQSNSKTLGTPRADSYEELDVLNEAWHGQSAQDNYLGALGVQGVANIYAQVATAVKNAGANTRLYTNEYNVLQFSPQSISSAGVASGSDPYANWYLNGVQSLQNDGAPISGIGMELYTNASNNVSASTMQQALQNMSVDKGPTGSPVSLSLTEFGVSTGQTPTQANYDADLTTALTMMYGDPQATTFGYWGGIGGPNDTDSATVNNVATYYSLYDSNYNLTAAGQTWEAFQNQYDTNLTLTTNASGQINFNGTYGLYDVIVNGITYELDLEKGTTNYGLMTPIATNTWNGGGADNNWSTTGNWGGTALASSAPLVFAGTANLAPNNNSAANTQYGGITFNSGAGAFVIGGNAINLGGDIVNNSSSLQTINLNMALQTNTNFNAASGNLAIGGNISGAFSLTKLGSFSLTLTGTNSYTGATNVNAGTAVVGAVGALPANTAVSIAGATTKLMLASNTGPETFSSLSITSGGTLDIGNNNFFTSDSQTQKSLILGYLAGGEITSSANLPGYGIGMVDGNDGVLGSTVSPGQLEVAYTLYGDANLDGEVTITDFNIFAPNFGLPTTLGWEAGDFGYFGTVNIADFNLFAGNFGLQDSGTDFAMPSADFAALDAFEAANGLPVTGVPEPATLSLASIAGVTLLRRRRRN